MSTKTTGMIMAKASPNDLKIMWKIFSLMENYGCDFYPDDRSPRAVRVKNQIKARLDQLGTAGFLRVVMGCDILIKAVCDPAVDHLALKPVYGAAPEMLAALTERMKYAPCLYVDDPRSDYEIDIQSEANYAAIAALVAKATMVVK